MLLHLTGSDWADGASHAGVWAFIVMVILAIVLFIRSRDGLSSPRNPSRRLQLFLARSALVVLLIYGIACQLLQPTLHTAQAHSLENQQHWQDAVNEYTLAGQQAPDGPDLARVYTAWGLALNKARHYSEAMDKFAIVMKDFYTQSEALKRAQAGDIEARLALGKQRLQANDYSTALTYLDDALNQSYCDDNCRQQALSIEATTYYQLGEAQLQTKQYDSAVTSFDKILNSFPHSPEAGMLHGDMAKALLGDGQDTRTNNCSEAVPIYVRLSKEYKDTPEGQKAQSDLNAPQQVKGKFMNTESRIYSQIALTSGLMGKMSKDQVFDRWDNAYQVTAIQSDGQFVFNNVKQGDYDLMWYSEDSSARYVEFIYDILSLSPRYQAHVSPLCPLDLGTVSNAHGSSML
ncbi:tetratricopeptide repeat protein [Ktedonosporobacter rubrisoli]|uniref:Tetratricopeptide repeat protein n=1 Tax=Ktedonosporobacter rubrisoli TaxID=2509675 RepID=A0A4P6JZ86_KTERU|nr:tetratricopeptide repeat protein [Ktedonosporobacter rubrisoli]QBD81069.1 tetratricopeptide repeat protein [Ktedonosporobacter rubrisoli]